MSDNSQNNTTSGTENIRTQVFDYSPDSILIIDPGQMKFVDANNAALKSLGYTKEELVGLTIEDVDAMFTNDTMAAAFESVIKSKEQHATVPTRHRRKDESIFDVEIYLRCFKDSGRDYILASATKTSVLKKTQEKLNFHSALFNKISDAIISTDENFVITSWNKCAEEIFGWKEAEALGYPTRDLTAAIFPNQTSEEVTQFVRDNGSWKGEIFAHRKDGEVIPVLLSVGVINGIHGNVTGYVSVVKDISDRYQLEAELRSLNEGLENAVKQKTEELINVFDRISDGFIAFDKDWNYTYVNRAAAKIIGVKSTALIGKNLLLENSKLAVSPFYKDFLRSMDEQISFHTEAYFPPMEKWFYAAYYPSPKGLSVYFCDITKKKLSEIALEESEARYRKAQAQGKVGHWHWDLQTHKLIWSEEIYKIFELDPAKELASIETFMRYVYPDDKDAMQEEQRLALAGLKNFNYYHRIILPNGTIKHLHEVADISKDEHGQPVYVSGMVQDVTEQKLIEDQLKDSRQQLSVILNNVVDAISLLQVEGEKRFRYIAVNDAYTKINKVDKSNAIGKLVGEIKPSENFDKLFGIFDQAIVTGKVQKFESIHEWTQGLVVFEVIVVPIENNAGNSDKILVIAKDVTERRLSEEKLIRSEENYKVLFEQTPIPIWMLDKDLNFMRVNQAAISQFGYTREEFLSMNVMQIKPPEDHAFLIELLKRGKGTLDYTGVTRHILKSGEIIYSRVHGSGLKFDQQDVSLVASKDITSELLFQKQLIENEQQLSLIFESTKDAMWLLKVEENNNYRVETYNKSYSLITGIDKEKAIGMLLEEILPAQNLDRIKGKYKRVVHTGETVSYYASLTFPKGEVTAEVTLTPIKDNFGKVVRILGTGVDVSQQQKSRRELVKMNVELRQLASHLQNIREEERTHIAREIHDELGQQLTGLKMDLAWLKKKLNGEGDLVANKLISALQLVDGTIDTVRKIASHLRPSIIDDLGIAEALDWHCQEFTQRTGINVNFSSAINDADLPKAIPTAIFRIVQEALTNVARHSKATEVSCTLEESNNKLILCVSDNGQGFSLTNQERKTLGLLGIRERVAILNGEYSVKSQAGEGTTISVQIPITS